MVRSSLLSLLLASATSFAPALAARGTPKKDVAIPGSYIVEFEDDADRSDFFSHIEGLAETHKEFDYQLFKGQKIQFMDLVSADAEAGKMMSLASVKNIWPNKLYHVPETEVKWTGSSTSEGPVVLQTKRADDADTYSPHVMTQVDKLRAKGVTGAGVKIGVVDTGVDYNHPALGGCFGDGCLVSYGTDLVGDDYTGYNTPVPDDDPWDGCEGHGTHVSGIIAAQAKNNEYDFTGAAPGVTLGMYRVFGCGGSAGNDVLIDAFMQAFEDGSQIITASIGGSSGWSEDPWAVAVSRIVEAGVPCTISAGNDGAYGMFYASTASNGKKTTSIASVDNVITPGLLITSSYTVDDGDETDFGYALGSPAAWTGVELPLWADTYDTTDNEDFCSALPDDTPDLSKYIVLIRRGTCTFVEKAQNAAEFGAQYIMFYNNVDTGATGPELTEVTEILANGMVEAAVGEAWVAELKAGSTVTLSMLDPDTAPVILVEETNNSTGGFLSTYSTWNPTFEMDIKPQFGSPGGNILSTYPIPLGSYAVLSGTSMACPMVAAIFALVASVRGTFDPETIENLLSATANPQLFNDGTDTYPYLAPVMQQGGGLVQAYDAAYATTLLSRSSIAFNDTDYLVPTANFTITNLGAEEVTYSLAHVGASTGYTFSTDIYPDYFPGVEMTAEYASISLSSSKITVPAGGDAVVSLTVTPPDLDGSRLPVYSGYITLNGTNGDSLSLPYNGAVGSLNSVQVLDPEYTYLTHSTDADLNPIVGKNSTFIIPRGSNSTTDTDVTFPEVVASLAFGSPKLDIQLLSYCGNSTKTSKPLGSIFGFPLRYMPRDPWPAAWDGAMADGTYAPAGKYAFEVKALHIFGDEEDEGQWDVATTVPFSLRYK